MQLIASKKIRYPWNGPTYHVGDLFEAKDRDAKTMIAAQMAKAYELPAKRKYKRRDMIAESIE